VHFFTTARRGDDEARVIAGLLAACNLEDCNPRTHGLAPEIWAVIPRKHVKYGRSNDLRTGPPAAGLLASYGGLGLLGPAKSRLLVATAGTVVTPMEST
jgi:hypothetical protein